MLAALFAFALAGTATADGSSPATAVFPGPAWDTATPAEAGMQVALLEQARDHALTGGGSGLIVRGGKLVFAWGDPDLRYALKSTTKSIGVTALGLALQDGLVGLTDAAQTHLPSISVPPLTNSDTGWLDDITIRQLATHSAGFDKTGGYIDLLFQPGTRWAYSDGGSNWLADMLTVRFNADLHQVMTSRVFAPLGITLADLRWRNHRYRDDTIDGIKRREFGSGINANVNAMARIGYLYLREGLWAGERIIPAQFVEAARLPDPGIAGLPIHQPENYPGAASHYGLLWWNNGDATLANVPTDAYWSWGLDESFIIVIPSLDIVVARAGARWRSGWNGDYSVLAPFLDPIVQSVTGVSPVGDKLTLAPTGDTFSNKGQPSTIFGHKKVLRAHGPNEKKIGFIQFDTTGFSGATVTSAALKLHVKDVVSAGILDVHSVSGAWNESTLTHSNKPGYGAPIVSRSLGAADVGSLVSVDITALAQQWAASPSSNLGIALTSQTALHTIFESRETPRAPVLEVTLSDSGNAAPSVTIGEPANGSNFLEGQTVTFTGSATDPEEGSLTGSLSWSSSRDGLIGSGGSVSSTTLGRGTHTITASVTDGSGASGSDSIEITIAAAAGGTLLMLTDIGDTFSQKSDPDGNRGNRKFMRARGPGEKQLAFVRFDVSELSGSVASANLEVHVQDVVTPGVLDVHGVQGDWGELTLTHTNKPGYGLRQSSVPVSSGHAGAVINLDVTALAQQWAASPSMAFGVVLTSRDSLNVTFDTREAGTPPTVAVDLH